MKLKLFIGIALIALAGPVQAGEPDANEIIRSLAPITYLPVHGGKPYRAIDLAVTFSSGSAVLTPEARQMLNQLGHALQSAQLRSSRFEVAGHTDASGSRQLNQALSDKRAKAAVRYLTKRFGIERSRLNAVGKGENELRDPLNPTARINRRVEIVNLTPVQPTEIRIKQAPSNKTANDVLLGK